MKTLKVALIQKSALPNHPQRNLHLGIQYIKEAKVLGADLVLFPEMWSHSYSPPFKGAFDNPYDPAHETERKSWLNSAISQHDDYLKEFRRAAKENQIGVLITSLSKGNIKPRNSAYLIDRNGEMILNYDKVHTCDFSLEGLLESGEQFKVCEFDGIKLGIMICYDREFPESARILMLQGAEIILVPNACDMNPARLNQLSTRAFENMVGVAMANYPGENWGHSCAFGPIVFDDKGQYVDNTLLMADDKTEDIYLVEFDMDTIRDFRQAETWGNAYRKVKTYHQLLDKTVNEPFIRKR